MNTEFFAERKRLQQLANYPEVKNQTGDIKNWITMGNLCGNCLGKEAQIQREKTVLRPFYYNGEILRIPKMEWIEETRKWTILEKPNKNETELWPIDENAVERRWGIEKAINEINTLKC